MKVIEVNVFDYADISKVAEDADYHGFTFDAEFVTKEDYDKLKVMFEKAMANFEAHKGYLREAVNRNADLKEKLQQSQAESERLAAAVEVLREQRDDLLKSLYQKGYGLKTVKESIEDLDAEVEKELSK